MTHKAQMLVNLIRQKCLECKTCSVKKSVFVKEYKPDKRQKYFL